MEIYQGEMGEGEECYISHQNRREEAKQQACPTIQQSSREESLKRLSANTGKLAQKDKYKTKLKSETHKLTYIL